jgi:hypothetical protein
MSTRVIVHVKGRVGIDDADALIASLSRETGLDWHAEHLPARTGTLSTPGMLVLQSVLDAAAGKALEAAAEVALKHTRQAVSRWRERRLDPPDVEIEVQEPAEGGPPAAKASGAAAAGG